MKRLALCVAALGLSASLGGCAISQVQLQTDLADAKAALSRAIEAYGIAKGIAEVAVAADPALAIPVDAIEAVIDPLIPLAQTLLTDAGAKLSDLNQLTQKIEGQIVAVETATASKIKVVPNGQ